MAARSVALSVLFVASVCSQIVFANDAKVVTAKRDQKSAAVSLKLGQNLVLRLPAQPGTGFSWQVLNKPALVQLESQSNEPGDESKPGAWQQQAFRFQVNTPGSETLEFGYQRPWEKDTPPAKKFSLRITIRK